MHVLGMNWHEFAWVGQDGKVVWWATGVSLGCCLAILAFMIAWSRNCYKEGAPNGGAFLAWISPLVALAGYFLWYIAAVIVAIVGGIWLFFAVVGAVGGSYSGAYTASTRERYNRTADVRHGVDQALRDAERRDSGWFDL